MVLFMVMFRRDEWTTNGAKKWLRDRKMFPLGKKTISDDFIRYPMAKPVEGRKYRLRPLEGGIVFVIMYPEAIYV